MSDLSANQRREDIQKQFPLECTLKVIAVPRPGLAVVLEQTLADRHPNTPFTAGNVSRQGSYQTYNATLTFATLEDMEDACRLLAAVPGVKMVL